MHEIAGVFGLGVSSEVTLRTKHGEVNWGGVSRTSIHSNKLAALRGDFKQAVFRDKELCPHFVSEERVLDALRLLVSLAERSSRSVA